MKTQNFISKNSNETVKSLPHLTFKKVKMNVEDDLLKIKITLPYLTKDNYFVQLHDGTLKVSLMTEQLIIDNSTKGVTKTKLKPIFLTGFLVLPHQNYNQISKITKVMDSLEIEFRAQEDGMYLDHKTHTYASA